MKKNLKEIKSHGDRKAFGAEVWKIKAMLPVLVAVMIILGSYSLVFSPKLGQIRDFVKNNQQMKTKIADINQRRAYIQSIDDAELVADQETLLMALSESKDIYFLLNVVTDLVSDYGFSVDSFSLSPGELKGESEAMSGVLSKLDFKINLVGPGTRYVELVNGLEHSLPILSLNGLESESVSSEFVKIDLGLTTYYASSDGEIDVDKLTYKDLLITEEELAVLEKLAGFKKIEGLSLDRERLDSGKQFEEYEIRNPFLPD